MRLIWFGAEQTHIRVLPGQEGALHCAYTAPYCSNYPPAKPPWAKVLVLCRVGGECSFCAQTIKLHLLYYAMLHSNPVSQQRGAPLVSLDAPRCHQRGNKRKDDQWLLKKPLCSPPLSLSCLLPPRMMLLHQYLYFLDILSLPSLHCLSPPLPPFSRRTAEVTYCSSPTFFIHSTSHCLHGEVISCRSRAWN